MKQPRYVPGAGFAFLVIALVFVLGLGFLQTLVALISTLSEGIPK